MDKIKQLRGGKLQTNDYDQIIRAYTLANNFDQLISTYQEIIVSLPSNQSVHLGLAQALASSGNINEANNVLDNYSGIQPDATKEIEELRTRINNGDFN